MLKTFQHDVNIIITSDHGTMNVLEPSKVIEKSISNNLRYKTEEK